jgi:hypothetical protein
MTLTTNQLSALSRLFSSSVFRELAMKGRSPLFTRLLRETGLAGQRINGTVGSTFDDAFAMLRRSGRRDEYVYRAALTHNILLGRHSLKTASLLTEFRAGSCKADLAILNGTASVYEIKSERDSLARLSNQLANYRRVFAKVYVIAAAPYVCEIIASTDPDVGVMSLARWDRIHTVREAVARPELVCPSTIFDSIRLPEARAILKELGVQVPDVPNTLLYGAMRERFALLDPTETHLLMVQTLKRTRNLASLETLVDRLPESLQPAALSYQVRPADHDRLVGAVRTPIEQAMAWS